MKKGVIISSVVILILILAGAYYLDSKTTPTEEVEMLTEEEIIGIVELELETYCQNLLDIAQESTDRKAVCSSRDTYNISQVGSNFEVSVLQRLVYGASTNRGSTTLKIVLDGEGNILEALTSSQ